MQIQYAVQAEPDGIARAFTIGKRFIGDSPIALILGDNLFYGAGLIESLPSQSDSTDGATIFGYRVPDPHRYGVVELDQSGRVVSLEEKPTRPRSHFAIPGFYFYDNNVVGITEKLRPSARGELEITDVNRVYLEQGKLKVTLLGRGTAWLDTGTPSSLLQASNFVEAVQQRQGLKIACIEEVAFRMGFIDAAELKELAIPFGSNEYGQYLLEIAEEGRGPMYARES
jgi:glucose-1-phosphate thymidylyltransferase